MENQTETQATRDPSQSYQERIAALAQQLAEAQKMDRRIVWYRAAVFALAVIAMIATWGMWLLLGGLTTAAVVVFIFLVLAHPRVERRCREIIRQTKFYEAGLARINQEWAEQAGMALGRDPEHHPYSNDLDLFGEASLFEFLCTARTSKGRQTLAEWLCTPADRNEIERRQQAVRELCSMMDFREHMAVVGDEIESSVHPEAFNRWLGADPLFTQKQTRILLIIGWFIPILCCIGLALWMVSTVGVMIVGAACFMNIGLRIVIGNRLQSACGPLHGATQELSMLANLLSSIETTDFSADKLRQLKQSISEGETTASSRARILGRKVEWLEARRNLAVALPALVMLWDLHWILAIERWRRRNGTIIQQWFETIGQMESLCALGTFAFERPTAHFPELVDSDTPVLSGKSLTHPLLKDCVMNDFEFLPGQQLAIISGSNMSGKSTFLRTTGIALVMAQMGAPVCASKFRFSLMDLASSIRVQDSLHDGESRFYAEVKQLQQLFELTGGTRPVFYLIDEIFHGTNSHDRRQGTKALVNELLTRKTIGILTSHDLELTKIAEDFDGKVVNMHFADSVNDGRLHFDYTLKPGVVTKSNAIQIMRDAGLPV